MRENAVAEDAVAERPVHGLSKAMAVVALYALGGGIHVVVTCLEDEHKTFYGGGHGKVVYHAHVKGYVGRAIVVVACLAVVEQHLAIGFLVDEIGMSGSNDGLGHVPIGLTGNLYVELVGIAAFEHDVYSVIGNEALALLEGLRREVSENLELVFGLANQRTKSNGYGQSDHSCPRYAHTHGVLQDVGR